MQSMYGGGSHDDDDDDDAFMPNPFRSGGGGTNNNNNNTNAGDLLGTPNPTPPPLHQQQQQQHIPDPNSGMTGSFVLPSPPPMQQQQQQQAAANSAQFLQGTMDQNVRGSGNNNNNYGSSNNNNNNNTGRGGILSFQFWTSCCRLDHYTQYFDMDTRDIQERLVASVLQFYKPNYFRCHVVGSSVDEIESNNNNTNNNELQLQQEEDSITMSDNTSPLNRKGPDLYGPVWISLTMVFLLGVTSNLAAWYEFQQSHHQHNNNDNNASPTVDPTTNTSTAVPPTLSSSYTNQQQQEEEEERFESDLTHMIRALSVITVFAWIMPTIFWLATTCLGVNGSGSGNTSSSSPIRWVTWICCYGYSLTIYCVLLPFCWLPGRLTSLIFISIASVCSCLLILRNLSTPLLLQGGVDHHGKAAPIILAIPAAHFVLACVLEWTFFVHPGK